MMMMTGGSGGYVVPSVTDCKMYKQKLFYICIPPPPHMIIPYYVENATDTNF
jgi:hypothetical protein